MRLAELSRNDARGLVRKRSALESSSPVILLQLSRLTFARSAPTNASTSIEPLVSLGTPSMSTKRSPLSLYFLITKPSKASPEPDTSRLPMPHKQSKSALVMEPIKMEVTQNEKLKLPNIHVEAKKEQCLSKLPLGLVGKRIVQCFGKKMCLKFSHQKKIAPKKEEENTHPQAK